MYRGQSPLGLLKPPRLHWHILRWQNHVKAKIVHVTAEIFHVAAIIVCVTATSALISEKNTFLFSTSRVGGVLSMKWSFPLFVFPLVMLSKNFRTMLMRKEDCTCTYEILSINLSNPSLILVYKFLFFLLVLKLIRYPISGCGLKYP